MTPRIDHHTDGRGTMSEEFARGIDGGHHDGIGK